MNWREHIISADPDTFEVGNIWSTGDNLDRITNDFVALLRDVPFTAIAAAKKPARPMAAAVRPFSTRLA